VRWYLVREWVACVWGVVSFSAMACLLVPILCSLFAKAADRFSMPKGKCGAGNMTLEVLSICPEALQPGAFINLIPGEN
jgi:hypothetical protein